MESLSLNKEEVYWNKRGGKGEETPNFVFEIKDKVKKEK